MSVHFISEAIFYDVSLRFSLLYFICILFTFVVLNCLIVFWGWGGGGIRVTQNANFHLVHLL